MNKLVEKLASSAISTILTVSGLCQLNTIKVPETVENEIKEEYNDYMTKLDSDDFDDKTDDEKVDYLTSLIISLLGGIK